MSEATLMRTIQLAHSTDDVRLWRNNNGVLVDQRGQHVTYGLGPGSSDLIGLRSIVITQDMVDRKVAVFCAIEVKLPTNRRRPDEQVSFIDMVTAMGGRAGFATSTESASLVLDGKTDITQP